MNKVVKMISILLMMLLIISQSFIVNAYTNNDIIEYIKAPHTINGRTYQLTSQQYGKTVIYLQQNPVTNSEADQMMANIQEAEELVRQSGATSLSQLDASIKSQVVSLVKEAGSIAGLEIEIDTVNELISIKDPQGNELFSGSYEEFKRDKLVYTGQDYTVVIKSILAIVAIAIIFTGGKKYAN